MVLETKIWALGVLIATGVSVLLGTLSWHSREIYVGILTYAPILIYKYLIYSHLYLYKTNHEFILISPTLNP